MHALLAALVLAAAPPPTKLAALSLEYFQVPKDQGDFFFQQLVQELTLSGLQVLSRKDVEAVLGLERQKQLLGCSDQSASCVAELASALGADGILQGNIGKVGGSYQLNFKVISARSATPLAAYSGSAESEKAVVEALHLAALSLMRQLSGAGLAVASTGRTLGAKLFVPAALGLVLVATATTCFIIANLDAGRLTRGDPTLTGQQQVDMLGNEGRGLQIAAWTTAVTAVVAFGIGIGLTLFTGSDGTLALAPSPKGVTVGYSAHLPW